MKLRIIGYAIIVFTTGILTSCKGQSENKINHLYEFKSIAIEYQIHSEGNGSKSTGSKSVWIDQYGNKQATFLKETSNTTVLGKTTTEEKEELNILDGNMSYFVNLKEKTGTKQNIESLKLMGQALENQLNPAGKSPRDLTREFLENNGGKWLGSETFLNKKCDVIEWLGTKQWLYKGIVLKSEAKMMGITISEIAVKLEEDLTIPAVKFEVPEGITLTDMETVMGEMNTEKKEDTDDIPGGAIGLAFEKFKVAVEKIKITDYKLLSCNNDEGIYMAIFFKNETEAFGIYGQSSQFFEIVAAGGEGAKVDKTSVIKGHKALFLTMEETDEGETTITKGLAVHYPEKAMTLMIAGGTIVSESTLISIVNQLNF